MACQPHGRCFALVTALTTLLTLAASGYPAEKPSIVVLGEKRAKEVLGIITEQVKRIHPPTENFARVLAAGVKLETARGDQVYRGVVARPFTVSCVEAGELTVEAFCVKTENVWKLDGLDAPGGKFLVLEAGECALRDVLPDEAGPAARTEGAAKPKTAEKLDAQQLRERNAELRQAARLRVTKQQWGKWLAAERELDAKIKDLDRRYDEACQRAANAAIAGAELPKGGMSEKKYMAERQALKEQVAKRQEEHKAETAALEQKVERVFAQNEARIGKGQRLTPEALAASYDEALPAAARSSAPPKRAKERGQQNGAPK